MTTVKELFDHGMQRSKGLVPKVNYFNLEGYCCFVGALALGAGLHERNPGYKLVTELIGKELGVSPCDLLWAKTSNGQCFEEAFDNGAPVEELIPQFQYWVDDWKRKNS